MSKALTCPCCAAHVQPKEDVRGKKLHCPSCGQRMVVTGAGIAKRDEGGPAAPAPAPAGRAFPWGWLATALLLSVAAIVGILLATRRPEPKEEDKPVATNSKDKQEPAGTSDKLRPLGTADPKTKPAPEPKTSPPAKPPAKNAPVKSEPDSVAPPVLPRPAPTPPAPAKKLPVLVHKGLQSLAFSPDGKTLATASDDKTIRLWDVASGRSIKVLTGHTSWVHSVAFSPDGKRLASSSGDFTVRLWDVASGANTATLSGHTDAPFSVAFSPDGKTLASSTYPGFTKEGYEIKLWDAANGQNTQTIKGPQPTAAYSPNRALAFSPDGKTLAGGSAGTTLLLWDVATGRKSKALEGISGEGFICVAYTGDGKTLVASTVGTVKVWDSGSGKLTRTLESAAWWDVACSPDAKTLASTTSRSVKLWDLATGKNTRTFSVQTDDMILVAFSPDGRTLAAGCTAGTIRRWYVGGPGDSRTSGQ